jgi:hypothetical protein
VAAEIQEIRSEWGGTNKLAEKFLAYCADAMKTSLVNRSTLRDCFGRSLSRIYKWLRPEFDRS